MGAGRPLSAPAACPQPRPPVQELIAGDGHDDQQEKEEAENGFHEIAKLA